MLAAYFAMARAQIEAHGGVVEKFIGDAVVGVFGVPAAHEDDPERAVRAGLRICEDAEDLTSVGGAPLKLRVGINTGEALVRLGVSAASGEGFLVGRRGQHRLTDPVGRPRDGRGGGPRHLRGHRAGLRLRRSSSPRRSRASPSRCGSSTRRTPSSRFGTDLTRTHDTPFIGREIDLALLKGIFDKTVAADSPQLVTVVGEPGSRQEPDRGRARSATSTPSPSSSPGVRVGACPTGKASPSGRSGRS